MRSAAAAIALVLSSLALFGCESLRRGANPEVPLWAKRPGGVLSVARVDPLTIDSRVVDEAFEKGRPALDVPHNRLFVGSSDRGLYAISAQDGATLWRFETMGPVQSEPLYDPAEDVVYFGSDDGALYKVAAADGSLKWRFMSFAEIERKPVLDRGTLFFVNANDTVVAADPATGKMKWNQHRAPIGGMSVAGYAGAAVWNGRVYTAFSDGHVMAYDAAEGSELWSPVDLSAEAEQTLGYQVPKYFDVDTTPIVDRIATGPVVYVASYSGGVFALDAETGARVWANEKATGVTELVLWTQEAHKPRDGGPTVPARRILMASSGTTGLWGLEPEEGTELWRKSLPEGGVSQPVPVAGSDAGVDHTVRDLPVFAAGWRRHRRHRHGQRVRDGTRRVWAAGVRGVERRIARAVAYRSAGSSAQGPGFLCRRSREPTLGQQRGNADTESPEAGCGGLPRRTAMKWRAGTGSGRREAGRGCGLISAEKALGSPQSFSHKIHYVNYADRGTRGAFARLTGTHPRLDPRRFRGSHLTLAAPPRRLGSMRPREPPERAGPTDDGCRCHGPAQVSVPRAPSGSRPLPYPRFPVP